MDSSTPDASRGPSGSSTPNPRFISQNAEAEEVLKSQTVGLVQLSDFRKRRAEAIEISNQAGQNSIAASPADSDAEPRLVKKKKKVPKKGGLSFGDGEEDSESTTTTSINVSRANTPSAKVTADQSAQAAEDEDAVPVKKKLAANASVGYVAKSMTKNALLRETQMKEQLRKEFLIMQEAVKATEFMIPFVFYEGADIAGGKCRMKKGDQVWLFLDRARKVGAEQQAGIARGVRQWARTSVDDLMLVRGDLIIPHHYEFYHFMVNKTIGYDGVLFPHSAEPTSTTPLTSSEPSPPSGLSIPDPQSKIQRSRAQTTMTAESDLEGCNDDPSLTKVVDRRWYEKHKHIFPASTWEEYDPTRARDYSSGVRKDNQGNIFFASK